MNDRRRAVLVLPDADIETSLQDARHAGDDHEVVAVLGNGAGWYAALALAGVIPDDAAQRIVREIARIQQSAPSAGGQVVYPLTDAAWRPDARLSASLDRAMATANGSIHHSVDLGAFAILDGTVAGVETLLAELPAVGIGEIRYPLLLTRPPFHSPLAAALAEQLAERVADTAWHMPELTLIDGRGRRHTPWSADPAALREDTLGAQLVETYRFATALRVALREYAPDVIIIPGNGGSLAAVCGQLVVGEGYRGIRSRRAFIEAQRRRPVVLSMRH